MYLLSFTASAQKTYISKSITVNDGLPQGFVSGIIQDDDGFIWLGTRDGLARYDGHEFKVFHFNDRRSTNISSNTITCLYHDHKNRIWILHESKVIDVFNPREERFEAFTSVPVYHPLYKQFSPNFISVDSQDNVWLVDPGNGLWKISLNERRIHHLAKHNSGLLCDTVRGIVEAPDKSYWVFMQKGVQQLDLQNNVIKTVRFDFPASNDINVNRNFAAGLAMADERNILVRERNKVFLFNTQKLSVDEIPVDNDSPDEVPGSIHPQRDPEGNLYFELMRSLYQYNSATKIANKIWDGELEQAQSFLIDHSGVAWFGNSASGLQILNLRSLPFKSYIYTSGFFVDLLGLNNVKFGDVKWMPHTRAHQYDHDTRTRYDYDSKGNLWMVFGMHSAVIDPLTNTFTTLPTLEGKDPAFHFVPMTVSEDTCWRVYSLTGTPVFFNSNESVWVYPLGKDWKLANPCNILDIVKTGSTIWAATKHDGLVAINISTGETQWFKQDGKPGLLSTNELTDLELDSTNDSLIWIGTRAGLVRFNMLTGNGQTFTVIDGLPNNTVYCIVADKKGMLWLSTNRGLCRFDPVSFSAQNFSGSDGLQGDEFNSFHKLTLPDGRIAFGGTEGFTLFDPLQINDDSFQPEVQLTKVRINNQQVELNDKDGILKDLLRKPFSLYLKHDQNFITFYFAGLQFNNVDRIQYRYRLNGFDKDWNYSGQLGMANYTKVPPGNYTLELNATNTSGMWSKNVKQVLITIAPPLWKTKSAYLLYTILFISALLGYVRYSVKKIRLENLVELKNKEAEQLKKLGEIKSRFFTNITHEFRTPLTLIISPLEQLLKDNDLHDVHKKQLALIQQNSRQLLQLIGQLLDLSKLEAGLIQTTVAPADLGKFLKELIIPFYIIADSKQLTLSFQSEVKDQMYFIDKDKIERIVNNVLSNAIKFTPDGGNINVRITKVESTNSVDIVSLCIADTGIGISSDALPYVFDRFYQVDDKATQAHEGTGIGLSLVKELTNLLNGTVIAESHVNKGSVFTVALPLSHAVLPATSSPIGNTIDSGNDVESFYGKDSDASHDKPLILVVEDNDALRGFLGEQLANSYTIITASNGKEAWEMIQREMPELVITDVMMPYMDGVALSRKIRQTEDTSHIGLIMLTAKTSAESKIEGLQTGANDYISKPFSFDELQLRVVNLLGHQKRQREYFYNQLLKNNPSQHQPKPLENPFLKNSYKFIEEALADKRTIGVEDLASHLSISTKTLNRKLMALIGLTANEFIRNFRLSRAAMLLPGELTVSEVAYQVGFESPQYFSQCFKALYNVTPTEYIQQQSEMKSF